MKTSKHPAMNLQWIMCTFKINTYSWDAMSMVNWNLVPFWDVFCCNALFSKKNPNSLNRFLILSVSKKPCRYHSCAVQCSGEHSLFNWRFKIMDFSISTDSYIAIIVNLYPSGSTMLHVWISNIYIYQITITKCCVWKPQALHRTPWFVQSPTTIFPPPRGPKRYVPSGDQCRESTPSLGSRQNWGISHFGKYYPYPPIN